MRYMRPEKRAALFKKAWEKRYNRTIRLLVRGYVQHLDDKHISHVCLSLADKNYSDAYPIGTRLDKWKCPQCRQHVPNALRAILTLEKLDV